ncbi:GNAT family N-acetyltransferase [Sporosarcina sp. G11-34]|uniref:GNAT family N-acetyltransferase n=1 Tax=Sporosarcina sp. G11-34 TaxID=2849605 RepID=UPI0022A9340E|nr:GNAT family N-acetyltransferase [Sporosarcina sp. G11-34]MCZ2260397.1 GNAT family N-acetyltransferase [Sporosarcina sp. G11-34]
MIRPMTSNDTRHVQHIARKTWSATYDGIIPVNIQSAFIDRSYSDAMMQMRMEKTIVLIAECEGTPVGFANFTKIDNDGDSELTAMYILPDHQHIGYGRKLFDYILSMLSDAQQLFVYVDVQNQAGRAFYEKQGFELLDVFGELFDGHPVETAQYVYTIQSPVGSY